MDIFRLDAPQTILSMSGSTGTVADKASGTYLAVSDWILEAMASQTRLLS
jgi:hypothetical protein